MTGQRRPWLVRAIDREVVVAAGAGLGVGLVAGALAFWVGSSRGLDSVELALLLELGSTFFALALVVSAGVMALWRDDLRAAALLLAILIGASLGTQAAFYLVPGNSTDGTLMVSFDPTESPRAERATCHWDRVAGTVNMVESRRAGQAARFGRAQVNVNLTAAPDLGVATFDVVAPFTEQLALRYEGSGRAQLEAHGRIGSITTESLSVRDLDTGGVPQWAAEQKAELAGVRHVTVEWECPRLP